MTDNKRNSVAGKVAMPKGPGGAPKEPQKENVKESQQEPVADLSNLGKILGAHIVVTVAGTNFTQSVEGSVHAVHPEIGLLLVKQPSTNGKKGDYKVTVAHVSNITDVKVLELDWDDVIPTEDLGNMPDSFYQKRLAETTKKLKKMELAKGKDVTQDAQELFDAFAKTLPVRWHGDNIVVNDAVKISKPYRFENIAVPEDKKQALPHIRNICEAFWRKKDTAAASASVSAAAAAKAPVATPVSGRKGG